VSPVKYELGFYIPEDDTPHSHRRENVKSYKSQLLPFTFFLFIYYYILAEVETGVTMPSALVPLRDAALN
jgi:hypothetical protein